MTTIIHATDSLSAFWIINSLFVFVLSVFCAGVLIPQILLISFRKRLFDVPDERKIHQGVVPRLGGIAFKPVVFFSVALALGLSMLLGYGQFLGNIGSESRPLAFGFCTIMMLYLVGMADDLIGIRYRAKFGIQIICGVLVIAGGLWVNDLPDKNHIHHKLLAIGMQQRTAMVTIVTVSVCFTLCNILLSRYVDATVLLVSDILIWTLANLWLTRKILHHSKL